MSETKHTPGPLQYCFEGSTAAFIVEADGTVVAKLSVLENSSGHSALVANTRLFAAAPELLEALQMILDEDMEDSKRAAYLGGFVLPDDLRQKARAAIAKADNHPKCATCSKKWTHEVTFYGMTSEFPIEVHDCTYDNKPGTVGFRPKRIDPDLDYCRNHSELSKADAAIAKAKGEGV